MTIGRGPTEAAKPSERRSQRNHWRIAQWQWTCGWTINRRNSDLSAWKPHELTIAPYQCGGPPATTLEPYPIDFNAQLPRHYPWRLAFRLTYIRAVHAQAADGGAASPAIAARRRVSVDLEKVHVHRRHSSRLVGVDHGHRDRVAWIACPRCRGRLQNSRYSVSPNRHAALRSVHQLG